MTASSLYRRHRPRSFDDVVGQEHVVRTLRNAIEQDRIHHAYLFVGSRGTGKTSMAKILATCLNCVGTPERPNDGPTIHPCGVCESCRSIAEATSIDVVEMDAASNNSVEDIRRLRDAVAFAPVGGHYKVYILDEAHMLSSSAWNAFLKTLEEPPPRTVFVLATTEASKVLPTVVDRCHRFDFHRPTPEQLAGVLQRVAGVESIDIDPEAVALVARHASGSFRDALGTLEQLVSYAGNTVTSQDVLSVLGVADAELLFAAYDAIAAGDGAQVLGVAAELARQGRDLVQVLRDLEAHSRALLLVRMIGNLPPEQRLTPDRDQRTVEQAQRIPGVTVIRTLDLIATALTSIRDGSDPRTQLELVLIRSAMPQIDPQAKALAARIARLEAGLPVATSSDDAPRAHHQAPVPADDAPTPVDVEPAPAVVVPTPAVAAPSLEPPTVTEPEPTIPEPPAAAVSAPEPTASVPEEPKQEASEPMVVASEPIVTSPEPTVTSPEPTVTAPEPTVTSPVEVVPEAPAPVAGAGPSPVAPAQLPTPAEIDALLPAIAEQLPGASRYALGIARTVSVGEHEIQLGVPAGKASAANLLTTDEARQQISNAISQTYGRQFRINASEHTAVPEVVEEPLPEEEVVRRMVQEFGAEEVGTADEAAPPQP